MPNTAQPFITVQKAVFVCRDGGGLYAMDANCTHHGCFVNFNTATVSFQCPCHQATFDFNGGSPTPPAPTPMPHYAMCISAKGTVIVDLGTVVDASTRHPV
jgi:Rieske Fe-S protein